MHNKEDTLEREFVISPNCTNTSHGSGLANITHAGVSLPSFSPVDTDPKQILEEGLSQDLQIWMGNYVSESRLQDRIV